MSFIDLDTWPRRPAYDFFLGFADPWMNVTAEVEVGETRQWCQERGASFSLACWYAVLNAANDVPAMRLRLREGGVWRHERLRVGATALRPDDTFTYVYYPSADDFPRFAAAARGEIDTRLAIRDLEPSTDSDDLIYGTVLPWVRFTSLKHAHKHLAGDSIPRVSLGRATPDGSGVRLPVNVEVHHALVDGVHVGQFFRALERRLSDPNATFGPAPDDAR